MSRVDFYRRWGTLTALLPASLMLILLLVLPLADMTSISFRSESFGQVLPGFTLTNYFSLLGDAASFTLILKTIGVAALVTLLCAALGFPLSAAVASAPQRWRGLLYFAVAAPLLVNTVVRSYGWLLILGRQGLVNSLLKWVGLIDGPFSLSGNLLGVIIGGTQVFLPFMVLSLTSSLQAIDQRLRESADILGAGPARRFFTVTLPLSAPGLIAGSVLVFSMMLGAFVTPLILGGSAVKYVSVQVYTDALVLFNLPRATALSLILTVVVLVAYAAHKRGVRRIEGRNG
ncbi:ABC transporter permease subunit [Variovorax guangxiensis]|uniref:ABC transporter permease subunit n=1 Tax=Variovorax guangxiensis TaxID=1775474 RepID=A0A3S0ZEF3_9BURK|nr:ABC transporter permease [Variovorax guangxiensis]RUR71264.1 ABC transporter permease subunit [Variovorax guangxiensis]